MINSNKRETTSNSRISFEERIQGMLFGVAYGDAVGAPVEKLSAEEIKAKYGYVTSLDTPWHRDFEKNNIRRLGRIRGNGIITDDTLMTIAVMEIYSEKPLHLDAWNMASDMVRKISWEPKWIPELQKETMIIERLFYPEKWIFQRHQLSNCEPREGGIGNMINCGAAMYIAPIGAVNACDPEAAYNEAINFASGHQASFGLEAAGVFAACVAAAFIPNISSEEIMDIAISLAKDGTKLALNAIKEAVATLPSDIRNDSLAVAHHLQSALAPFSPMGDNVGRSIEELGVPSDFYTPSRLNAIEELPMALGYLLINQGDFYTSVLDGINSGRDTDSIGVMAGAIAGVMHGEQIIKPEFLQKIDKINRFDLTAISKTFARSAQRIIEVDIAFAEKRMKQITTLF